MHTCVRRIRYTETRTAPPLFLPNSRVTVQIEGNAAVPLRFPGRARVPTGSLPRPPSLLRSALPAQVSPGYAFHKFERADRSNPGYQAREDGAPCARIGEAARIPPPPVSGTRNRSELRGPNRPKPPHVEGCTSDYDTKRGEARTPGLRTPLSTLAAPAHFTLTIHFLDTERLPPLFHSFPSEPPSPPIP
ncbi:hypothetical protein D623_10029128 [Myotis brandtii]|uniref:Uncharacterized protein n=1 Tax=Myotis brandtii TaxID=109478 RepID=S7MQW6_MYOBR|nr:hypothetical protein D623_10029128 [Myotis brandtii]